MVTRIPSTAQSRDVVIGVASSLIAFILATVLFLTIGLACGCFCGQKWKKTGDKATENQSNIITPIQPNPLYEDIVIQEQELELKENAAYSSVSHFNR